jgi:predicted MarR family transcription regulator
LLKRDDQSNLQYGIRKLLKSGLIEKSQDGKSKKDVTYRVSALGREVTDNYAIFRNELLISLTRSITGERDLESIAKVLNLMSGLYDQASCVAATHRVPLQ